MKNVLEKQINSKTCSKAFGRFGAVAAISAALATSNFTVSFAADEVGKSVRIKNIVNGSLGNRKLAPRDPVFVSEDIRASANSHGELLLNDRSKVLVGENSVISLDDFVVGSRGFDSGTVKVAKGAFRFISGNSKKGSMKVETPVSTIGVRGTIFDVYVAPTGITRVILFKGEVEVCSQSNCITTNNPCDIVEVDSAKAEELPYLRGGDRGEENEAFGLTSGQSRFQTGWRAPTFTCDVRAFLDPDNPNKKRRKRKGPIYQAPDDGPLNERPTYSPCSAAMKPKYHPGSPLYAYAENIDVEVSDVSQLGKQLEQLAFYIDPCSS